MMKPTCLVEASDVIDLVVVDLKVVALVFRHDVDLCNKGTRQSTLTQASPLEAMVQIVMST